jgi:hypothetical protein
MRPSRYWPSFVLALSFAVAACGPSTSGDDDGTGDDDGGGDLCTGDTSRCLGNVYQTCVDGMFETQENCTGACSPDLGCVECNPDAGNACDGANVVTCNADGTLGEVVETCGNGETCSGGECSRDCTADGVDLIYVVDDANHLLSFDPRNIGNAEHGFTLIGTLTCPAGSAVPGWAGPVGPFSMSVDRNGTAWVLYSSGEIFNVNINNAQCSTTTFQKLQMSGQWALFGMGFVTDEAGGNTEQLYIGGGDPAADPGGLFGVVDSASLAITTLGNLPNDGEYSPEFTGLGSGELFGFYPGLDVAFVQGLNKTNGMALGNKFDIPGGLCADCGGLGAVEAWAFAQWGGTFYLFVTTTDGFASNSTVRTIDRATGTFATPVENLQYKIVGAGVSTCAPVDVE